MLDGVSVCVAMLYVNLFRSGWMAGPIPQLTPQGASSTRNTVPEFRNIGDDRRLGSWPPAVPPCPYSHTWGVSLESRTVNAR